MVGEKIQVVTDNLIELNTQHFFKEQRSPLWNKSKDAMLGIAKKRNHPFLLFLKKTRSISSTQRPPARSLGYECFCRKVRSPFIYTRGQKCDRLFGISQKVRLPSPILLNLNTSGNTQTISDL
jgi:hypothetical protein